MADTGWVTAGSGSTGTPSGGGTAWSSAGNITANDNNDANAGSAFTSVTSEVLRASNFGFSIPSGAIIDGIEVRYERFGTTSGSASLPIEVTEQLIGASASFVGNNKSGGATWEGTRTLTTLGGSSDKWGTSLTRSDINDSDFGFGIQAEFNGGGLGNPSNAFVDYVQIRVHYTPLDAPSGCSASQIDGDKVQIIWNDNSSNEDNFRLERNIDSAGWTLVDGAIAANSTSYTDTPPKSGSIQYRIRAENASGNTAYSTSSAINFVQYTGRGVPIIYY